MRFQFTRFQWSGVEWSGMEWRESLFTKKIDYARKPHFLMTTFEKSNFFPKIFIGPVSLSEIWSIFPKISIGPESLSESWSILGVGKSLQLFPRFGKSDFSQICPKQIVPRFVPIFFLRLFPRFVQDVSKMFLRFKSRKHIFQDSKQKLKTSFPTKVSGTCPHTFSLQPA